MNKVMDLPFIEKPTIKHGFKRDWNDWNFNEYQISEWENL